MANVGSQISAAPTASAAPKRSTNRIYDTRYGGFPISHRDALAWANRIRTQDGKPLLTDAPRHSGSIMGTIEPIIEAAGGVACYPHGQIVAGKPYESYLIVTQYEEGEWHRVDGVLEPGSDLVEGEKEEIGKQLLRREDLVHLKSTFYSFGFPFLEIERLRTQACNSKHDELSSSDGESKSIIRAMRTQS
ncbi:hypothetical protein BDP27DRAFT_1400929 [Rhodocollybia butyracea]|uniref:Uncharacterized protein n=1 Tax=Rhodocollybia butyracea TaxID=206335 RepID=A0A9P5PYI6_9AGAR|nr:hypothetical protein BDP27DRAFT_1400929 [Rhodocollybia butyracea]